MPAGFLAIIFLFFLLIIWPLIFIDLMLLALYKLGISPLMGLVIVLAIIIGSFINVPIKRYPITHTKSPNTRIIFGLTPWLSPRVIKRDELIIAINVGGCVVPLLLTVYLLVPLLTAPTIVISIIAIIINVALCYHISELKPGIGILMPAFYPGVIAALSGWLLYPENPSAIAFCSGVLGPLIGADVLRLNQVVKLGGGSVSIGGAGTFDGIIISAFIALLLS